MFKVIDPDGTEVHQLHMFPSTENVDRHEFTEDCFCQPYTRSLSDYPEVQAAMGDGDDHVEHVIVEHNRTDH